MKRFIIVTLTVVIVILILRNADVFSQVIKTVTDLFAKSFRATVEVGQ